jgi:hypothetical protein
MKPRMILAVLIFSIVLAISFIGLKNNPANAQESPGGATPGITPQAVPQGAVPSPEIPEPGSNAEISQKLDQVLANQDRILDRLGAIENELIHEIRVRATH